MGNLALQPGGLAKRRRGAEDDDVGSSEDYKKGLVAVAPRVSRFMVKPIDVLNLSLISKEIYARLQREMQRRCEHHYIRAEEVRAVTEPYAIPPRIFESVVSSILPPDIALTRESVWILQCFVEELVTRVVARAASVAKARARLSASEARSTVKKTVTDMTVVVEQEGQQQEAEVAGRGKAEEGEMGAATCAEMKRRSTDAPVLHQEDDKVIHLKEEDEGDDDILRLTHRDLDLIEAYGWGLLAQYFGGLHAADVDGSDERLEQLIVDRVERLVLRARVTMVGPGVKHRLAALMVRVVHGEIAAVVQCLLREGTMNDRPADLGVCPGGGEGGVSFAQSYDEKESMSEGVDKMVEEFVMSPALQTAIVHSRDIFMGTLALHNIFHIASSSSSTSETHQDLLAPYEFMQLLHDLHGGAPPFTDWEELWSPDNQSRLRIAISPSDARALHALMAKHVKVVLKAVRDLAGDSASCVLRVVPGHWLLALDLLQVRSVDAAKTFTRTWFLSGQPSSSILNKLKDGISCIARASAGIEDIPEQLTSAAADHVVLWLKTVLLMHWCVSSNLAEAGALQLSTETKGRMEVEEPKWWYPPAQATHAAVSEHIVMEAAAGDEQGGGSEEVMYDEEDEDFFDDDEEECEDEEEWEEGVDDNVTEMGGVTDVLLTPDTQRTTGVAVVTAEVMEVDEADSARVSEGGSSVQSVGVQEETGDNERSSDDDDVSESSSDHDMEDDEHADAVVAAQLRGKAVVTEEAMRRSIASRWEGVGYQVVYGSVEGDQSYEHFVPEVVQRSAHFG